MAGRCPWGRTPTVASQKLEAGNLTNVSPSWRFLSYYFYKGHFVDETECPWPLQIQALPLVEKAEPVQVWFTLYLRDQWSMWMWYGCKGDVDSYMASNGSCFMVTWIVFNNRLLEVGLTQQSGDRGTLNAHNRWFVVCYHVWGPAWIDVHWNSIWSRAQSHMASRYTWGSVTTLHDIGGVLGQPSDTFFWALAFSWSRLLVRVWNGIMCQLKVQNNTLSIVFNYMWHVMSLW